MASPCPNTQFDLQNDFLKFAHSGELGRRHPGLKLLVLHGSRARGDCHEGSDWDFAYLAGDDLDTLGLRNDICEALKTELVDLADLNRAGGLLRHRVAKEGKLVWERSEGDFMRFTIEVTRFWLHVGPVVEASHAAVLKALG